jgi:hypothetical protein
MNDQLTVQVIGPLIVVQLRGVPTPELLGECQAQVLAFTQGAQVAKVLYDAREMAAPPVDVPWAQRQLDESMSKTHLRRAIVVPNSRLAFLARLAFGAGDYRVFYDDIDAATHWLTEGDA